MDMKGFIPASLLEWEGKLASVIFLPRCNLRCRYCHAGDLVLRPERMDTVPPAEPFAWWRANRKWVDGVAITGGEPTLQGRHLLALIDRIKALSLDVMVETNGTQPDCVENLVETGRADALAMDFKAPLTPADYRRVAGVEVDVDAIRRSMELVRESGLEYEFRVTVVPGLIGREELEQMLPDLEGSRQVALQNFRPDDCLDPELRDVVPYRPDELNELAAFLRPAVGRCVVRGQGHGLSAARPARGNVPA